MVLFLKNLQNNEHAAAGGNGNAAGYRLTLSIQTKDSVDLVAVVFGIFHADKGLHLAKRSQQFFYHLLFALYLLFIRQGQQLTTTALAKVRADLFAGRDTARIVHRIALSRDSVLGDLIGSLLSCLLAKLAGSSIGWLLTDRSGTLFARRLEVSFSTEIR